MKIGIVTVYQSYNCGSFLQAYALQETFKNMGHDVCFIKNTFSKTSKLSYRLMQAIKYYGLGQRDKARYLLGLYFNFKKARKSLKVKKNNDNIDFMVYGSDTIWCISDEYFMKNYMKFWGHDFSGKKITYAVSVGDSTDIILKNPQIYKTVPEFECHATRDKETYDFVKKVLGPDKEIKSVMDPVFLLDIEHYRKIMPACPDKNYILFYYFCGVPKNVVDKTKEFAKKTNRKIIVIGEKVDWADKCIINDPFKVLCYYDNADFIITNTFHGSAFSLIFNKQFISFGGGKQKVRNLLEQFGLSDRIAEPDSDFECLFEQEIDFEDVNIKREALKEESLDYLKNAINSSDGDC